MINIAYKIESAFNKIGLHWLDTLIWHLLRLFLNFCYPLSCKLVPCKTKKLASEYVGKEVIISLTSFPARIRKLPIILETLFRQTVSADRIVLWLANSQFENRDDVEHRFRKYIQRGLEIRYCEDIKAHKKYYFTMLENPDAFVITVDDDIFFSDTLVENLLTTYLTHPDCIICTRAHKMQFDGKTLSSYSKWNMRAKGETGPDVYLCPTGGAGCLYPPMCLSKHVFDKDVLIKKCLYADDIWMKCMSFMIEKKVVLTEKNNPEIIDVIGGKTHGLAKKNVEQNMNDVQLNAVAEHYNIDWNRYRE